MASYLIRVDLHNLCAGCVVTDGVVTGECAPILRRWVGQPGRRLIEWARAKGGEVTWLEVSAP